MSSPRTWGRRAKSLWSRVSLCYPMNNALAAPKLGKGVFCGGVCLFGRSKCNCILTCGIFTVPLRPLGAQVMKQMCAHKQNSSRQTKFSTNSAPFAGSGAAFWSPVDPISPSPCPELRSVQPCHPPGSKWPHTPRSPGPRSHFSAFSPTKYEW